MRPTLRAAVPRDAGEIRDLMARTIALIFSSDEALQRDTLSNVNGNVDFRLKSPIRCVHIVASVGDRIVGVVLVKDFWNMCSLFVANELHRQGLGRALVEAAVIACRPRSPKKALFLNAATNAIGFYERLGFQPCHSTQPLPPGFKAITLPL